MNSITILILVVIALLFVLALRHVLKHGSCGSCRECAGGCSGHCSGGGHILEKEAKK